jgi:hypothetical protein
MRFGGQRGTLLVFAIFVFRDHASAEPATDSRLPVEGNSLKSSLLRVIRGSSLDW